MVTSNKEYGSDFAFYTFSDSEPNYFGKDLDVELFFSGRVALFRLLEWGVGNEGWKKVFIPSYYCHEVVHFLSLIDIVIEYYDFNPFTDSAEYFNLNRFDAKGNVFINVDFFGLKKIKCTDTKELIVVDDLTHNLESINHSVADFCFGSLRKILPLPTGGFLFSPRGQKLPKSEPSIFSEEVSIEKLSAMYMKSKYLNGAPVDKNIFRNFFIEAEENFQSRDTIAALPISSLSILRNIDIVEIYQKKKDNLFLITDNLTPNINVSYNLSTSKSSALGLMIEVRLPNIKQELKSFLISKSIYPATLWPNQISVENVLSSELILFLHIDFRYNRDDMIYIADTLNYFFTNYGTNN